VLNKKTFSDAKFVTAHNILLKTFVNYYDMKRRRLKIELVHCLRKEKGIHLIDFSGMWENGGKGAF